MDMLVKKYGDSLLRMCFLYLKDIHLAEDVVQERNSRDISVAVVSSTFVSTCKTEA